MAKTEHERLSEKATAKTRDARTYDEHHDAAEAHQQAAQAKGRAGYGVEAAKHSSEAVYHRTKAAQKPPLAASAAFDRGAHMDPQAASRAASWGARVTKFDAAAFDKATHMDSQAALRRQAAGSQIEKDRVRQYGPGAAAGSAGREESLRFAREAMDEAAQHRHNAQKFEQTARELGKTGDSARAAHYVKMAADSARDAEKAGKRAEAAAPKMKPANWTAASEWIDATPRGAAVPAHLEHTAAKSSSAAGSDAQRLDKEVKMASEKALSPRQTKIYSERMHAMVKGATTPGASPITSQVVETMQAAARKHALAQTALRLGKDKLRPVSAKASAQAAKTKAAVAVKQVAALKAQPAGRSRAGGPALYFKEGYGTKYPTGPLQKGKKGGTFLLINGNKYYVGKK